jgi:phosphonate transport system permease protein
VVAVNAGAAPRPFGITWLGKLFGLLAVAYVLYAAGLLDFSYARFVEGLGRGARFIGRMFPPDLSKMDILWKGVSESLEIAVLATAAGVLLSLPLGLLGARNMMPGFITWPVRAVVVMCRSLHPVIVAVLFVKAVGFGALAGICALVVASIGFVGKLFTEAIEEISMKQVEAIRATGAPFMGVVLFGVLPQVFDRFVGFATYQFDSNLRNSTMVGIVGAGGIGGPLFSAFQRFDYNFVFTILFTIILMIVIAELATNALKKAFAK